MSTTTQKIALTKSTIPTGAVETLWGLLAEATTKHPNRTAAVFNGVELTYQQLTHRVLRVAGQLRESGLKPGQSVALWIPNSLDWIVYALAINRVRGVLFPVNTRYKIREAEMILDHSGSVGVVYTPQYFHNDYRAILGKIAPQLFNGDADIPAVPSLAFGIELSSELDAAGSDDSTTMPSAKELGAEPTVDDDFLLLYTSGTTGRPKGVLHTNVVIRNVHNIANALHVVDGDRFLGHMPLYHIAGFCTAFAASLASAGTYYVMAEWEPAEAVQLIERHKIAILGGIPTHYIDLVDAKRASGADTSSLKTGWIGGANVPSEVVEKAMNSLEMDALQAVYGATETTSSTTLTPFAEAAEKSPQNLGQLIGDFEVGIFDLTNEEQVPDGKAGEIRVRGHIVMKGYLNDPEATANAITEDGWYRTGDIGKFVDGYLTIVGRVKDMYIIGGVNVYPAEIEAVLAEIDGVRQVVVVGIPHNRLGEVGKAFIQLDESTSLTEADILDYCTSQLAGYKVPHIVQFMTEFPMTSSGKIQRAALG